MLIRNILKIIILMISFTQYTMAGIPCYPALSIATVNLHAFKNNWVFMREGSIIYEQTIYSNIAVNVCKNRLYYGAQFLSNELRTYTKYGFDLEISGSLTYGNGSGNFLISPSRSSNIIDLPREKNKTRLATFSSIKIRAIRNRYAPPLSVPTTRDIMIGKVMNSNSKGRKEYYRPIHISFFGGDVRDCRHQISLNPKEQSVNFNAISTRDLKAKVPIEQTFSIGVKNNTCPVNLNVSLNLNESTISKDLTQILLNNKTIGLSIYDGTEKLKMRGATPLFAISSNEKNKSKTLKAVITPVSNTIKTGPFTHHLRYRVTYK